MIQRLPQLFTTRRLFAFPEVALGFDLQTLSAHKSAGCALGRRLAAIAVIGTATPASPGAAWATEVLVRPPHELGLTVWTGLF